MLPTGCRSMQIPMFWVRSWARYLWALLLPLDCIPRRNNMPKIGPLPEPLNSTPLDLKKHWSILDQTKADFKKSGRSGVVIIIEPDDQYRAKLAAFLAKFNTPCDVTKTQLVLEH